MYYMSHDTIFSTKLRPEKNVPPPVRAYHPETCACKPMEKWNTLRHNHNLQRKTKKTFENNRWKWTKCLFFPSRFPWGKGKWHLQVTVWIRRGQGNKWTKPAVLAPCNRTKIYRWYPVHWVVEGGGGHFFLAGGLVRIHDRWGPPAWVNF